MAKNRKRNVRMGVVPKVLFGAVVLASVGALVFWSVDSKCNALAKDILLQEQEYAKLENAHKHEDKRWREMWENHENLDRAVKQKGLAMDFPSPDQIVRIDAAGVPLPNQPSLARFKKIAVAAGSLVHIAQ